MELAITRRLDTFTRAYLEAALWSSTDDDAEPLDAKYDLSDIHANAIHQAVLECEQFRAEQAALLAKCGLDESRQGHEFWLSRNGHGSGFWDAHSQTSCEAYEREQARAIVSRDFSARDALDTTCPCPYHVCQRLSVACRRAGERDLYVGDDGQLYF